MLDRTAPSPKMEVVAARISSVELVVSGSGVAVSSALNAGWCNVAIIKMATDVSPNSEPNGNLARILLDKIRLNIQKNPGLTISQVQIGRVQTTGINFISAPYSANTELDMSVASDADRAIDPASSAYFLIKVKIESLDPNSQDWVQVSLNNLDTDASTANIVFRDGNEAAQKTALRLPTSILAGTKIVE